MTARQALAILSQTPPQDLPADATAQEELNRAQATWVLAEKLGFDTEALHALALVKAIIAKDEAEMQLFKSLGADQSTGGDGK